MWDWKWLGLNLDHDLVSKILRFSNPTYPKRLFYFLNLPKHNVLEDTIPKNATFWHKGFKTLSNTIATEVEALIILLLYCFASLCILVSSSWCSASSPFRLWICFCSLFQVHSILSLTYLIYSFNDLFLVLYSYMFWFIPGYLFLFVLIYS